MRPLKLIISGFGTYCNKTEIDLTKFGKNGLFLVTGDTGSGKTTIFDAITYALYGDVNGQNRNVNMIRSSFATPDIPTEVELTFEYKNEIYNVKRNPDYQRASKRGDGLTTQIAEATLTFPNGKVVTKSSNVTNAIIELLRINKEQFSQIVMIAQGDFQKLLMEGTERRIEIFRNLFKTDYYLQLQNKLSDEEKALANECKSLRQEMNVHLSSVSCEEENVLSLELEKSKELPIEEVTEVIKKIIVDDCKSEEKISHNLEKIEKKLLENAKILGKIKTLEEAKTAKVNKINLLEKEKELHIQLTQSFENAKSKIPEREKKEKDEVVLSKEISSYNELDKLSQKTSTLQKNIARVENEIANLELKSINLQSEKINIANELKKLQNAGTKILDLQTQIEKLQEKISDIKTLKSNVESIEKTQNEYNNALEQYKKCSNQAEQDDISYKKLRKIYMDEQAGLIAQTLEENKPCPVCGSIHHPQPAKKSEESPSEEQLNSAEKKAEESQKITEEKNRICIQLKTEINNKTELIKNEAEKLFGEATGEAINEAINETISEIKTEVIASKINDSIEELSFEVNEKSANLETEQNNEKRKSLFEQRLPQLENEIDINNKTQNQLNIEKSSNDSELRVTQEQLQNLKTKLRYETKNEAESVLQKMRAEISQMKEDFESTQNKLFESTNKIAALEGEIKQLEAQNAELQTIDSESAYQNEQKFKAEKEELLSSLQNVKSRIDRNKNAITQIEKNIVTLAEKEKKYSWVATLSKTANGNLANGKERIKLETFIQMNYFDRILRHANKRLMIMSDGQYELIRKKEADNFRSQTGLELNVIDHYSGTERSVKSLSGGESFEASLALALGLSDEVKMSAGGIQLDSMFVDEGFGTLDSETLQKAFKALSSITDGNRIVGIISHVDLLKEKIEKQIVVKKERTGGSSVKIVV